MPEGSTGLTSKDWLSAGIAGAGLLPMLFGGGGGSKEMDAVLKQLQGASDRASGMAKDFSLQGSELFGPAADYFKAVSSGDRQALLQATMPERKRVIDQYATAKRALGMQPRSGGTAAAGSALEAGQASDLAATTAGARTQGAQVSADLGKAMQSLGLSAEALASGDLNAILQALEQKEAQKGQSAAGLGQALGTILPLLFAL